jgi:hypothetical protein
MTDVALLLVQIVVVCIALATVFAISFGPVVDKLRLSRLFHRWAMSRVNACEPHRRPVPRIVVDYFLQTATREWAVRAGYVESDEEIAAIDAARRLGLPAPRRFHLSLSYEQQDYLLGQVTKVGSSWKRDNSGVC